jgi:hypothetical protein
VALALFYHRQNPQKTQAFFPKKFTGAGACWHRPCPPHRKVRLRSHKPGGGLRTARPTLTGPVTKCNAGVPPGEASSPGGGTPPKPAGEDARATLSTALPCPAWYKTGACRTGSLDVKFRTEIPMIGGAEKLSPRKVDIGGVFWWNGRPFAEYICTQ